MQVSDTMFFFSLVSVLSFVWIENFSRLNHDEKENELFWRCFEYRQPKQNQLTSSIFVVLSDRMVCWLKIDFNDDENEKDLRMETRTTEDFSDFFLLNLSRLVVHKIFVIRYS